MYLIIRLQKVKLKAAKAWSREMALCYMLALANIYTSYVWYKEGKIGNSLTCESMQKYHHWTILL